MKIQINLELSDSELDSFGIACQIGTLGDTVNGVDLSRIYSEIHQQLIKQMDLNSLPLNLQRFWRPIVENQANIA